MSTTDILALRPLIILAAAPVLIMLSIAIKRAALVTTIFSILVLASVFISLFYIKEITPLTIEPLLIIDGYSLFYIGLISASGISIILLSHNYLSLFEEQKEEFFMLIFLALLGASVLVASKHFVSLFLGLEILSVSLYTMIAYLKSKKSIEGGIKYLILAGASSAFLLFGIALIYLEIGSMDFMIISHRIFELGYFSTLTLTGLALIIVGIGFKLAIVPFHMWTPDVYEGAPSPVTAFIATISKGGMFAVLFRFFVEIDGYQNRPILIIFTLIAIASMFTGNILALVQNNVKRILAYSSIAHLGYILVAFLAGGTMGIKAVTFYLSAYFITTIGAFGVITVLSNEKREAELIDDYKGLFWLKPVTSTIFSAMLFSLAGIPLTAGFLGKFYVVAAGINSNLWFLTIILVINSAIGLYYYLRIVAAMYSMPKSVFEQSKSSAAYSLGGGLALAILTILLIWFGTFPSGILDVIETMITSLV